MQSQGSDPILTTPVLTGLGEGELVGVSHFIVHLAVMQDQGSDPILHRPVFVALAGEELEGVSISLPTWLFSNVRVQIQFCTDRFLLPLMEQTFKE